MDDYLPKRFEVLKSEAESLLNRLCKEKQSEKDILPTWSGVKACSVSSLYIEFEETIKMLHVLKMEAREKKEDSFVNEIDKWEEHWLNETTPLTPKQLDKAEAQEIARRIMDNHPTYKVEKVARILIDGTPVTMEDGTLMKMEWRGGVKGVSTIRDWLKGVGPAPKRGRPPKSST